MIPAYTGLETALRGLMANQAAIDTTGQNIANANTPGYSRQSADMTESYALGLPAYSNVTGAGAQLGTGVDISTISRIRNQFLDVQYRAQNSSENSASSSSDVLGQVQAALAEPTDHGLSSQLHAFWGSWSALASHPTDQAARGAVVSAGQTAAGTLNALDQQLSTIKSQTQQQYAALTGPGGQVQTDAQKIASLNTSISQAQAAGQTPNNLLDQRDQVLDDLSSLGTISVTAQSNGMVNVSLGDAATPLVSGATVTWPQTITSATGGKLGALLSLTQPGGQIDAYRTQLDTVANSLISSVNALHTTTPFFSGNSAATIAVAATAATVQTSSTLDPGGNDVALKIAALSGGTADQGWGTFVAKVGGDVQSIQNTQQTAQAVLSAIGNQRQSVSGVSLDEEMTHLITYQRGYEASAKVMNTINSMLNTLINNTGV